MSLEKYELLPHEPMTAKVVIIFDFKDKMIEKKFDSLDEAYIFVRDSENIRKFSKNKGFDSAYELIQKRASEDLKKFSETFKLNDKYTFECKSFEVYMRNALDQYEEVVFTAIAENVHIALELLSL